MTLACLAMVASVAYVCGWWARGVVDERKAERAIRARRECQ